MSGYPPLIARLSNFKQAQDAGQAIDTSTLDGELNQLVEALDLVNTWVRGITTADNLLKGVSAKTAMALAGSQRFVATASQTVFTTTIAYDAAMTSTNVEVFSNGVLVDSNSVTVSDVGGLLSVTIPAQTVSNVVFVAALTPGAGVVSRLADTTNAANGASMVGIMDSAAIYTAVTAEDALAEVMVKLNTLITNVGATADLIRRTGTVAFTADLSMGSNKITSLANGVSNTDAVNVQQLNSAVQGLTDALNQFLRLDGSSKMTGDLDMNGNAIVNASNPPSPIGGIVLWPGAAAPASSGGEEWALCQGQAISRTTYSALFAITGTYFGVGDGSTTFNLPDLRGAFPRGVDNGRGLDSGRALGSYQSHAVQDHAHSLSNVVVNSGGGINYGWIGGTFTTTGATGAMSSGNIAAETRPVNVAVNFAIKIKG